MNALVVSAAEAATMLKLSKSQILAELEAGSIEAYRDGRNWKISIVKAELEDIDREGGTGRYRS